MNINVQWKNSVEWNRPKPYLVCGKPDFLVKKHFFWKKILENKHKKANHFESKFKYYADETDYDFGKIAVFFLHNPPLYMYKKFQNFFCTIKKCVFRHVKKHVKILFWAKNLEKSRIL